MKIGLSFKKRSVIINWLTSYLVFLLLFVVISIATYMGTKEIIKSDIDTANSFMLNGVRNNMDNILNDIKKLGFQISVDPRIQNLLMVKNDLSDSEYYDVYKIITDMRVYNSANSSIGGIYIVLKDINKVIYSDSGVSDMKTFYASNFSKNDEDYLAWMKELNEKSGEKIFPMPLDKSRATDKKITYVKAISRINFWELSNGVGIIINEESLKNQLASIDSINKGSSFILDSKNEIIASSSNVVLPQNMSYSDLSGENGTLYKKFGNKKMVVSYISSKVTDWKYVTIIPESVFLQKLNYARNIAYFAIFMSLLLGIALTYFFLKKNYNPVTKLLSILHEQTSSLTDKESNEYVMIEKAITQTLKDNDIINRQLSSQRAILKSNFLEKLLKGGVAEDLPLDEALLSFDIKLESNYFAVASFYLDDSEENLAALNSYFEEGFNALNFIISNVVEELINRNNKAYIVELDGTLACLINFKNDRTFFAKSDMLNSIEESQNFIKQYFKIDFSFTTSSIHQNIESVSAAYNESIYAMNYKNIMGIKHSVCFDEIKDIYKDTYYYPISKEQQLINHIKSGNYTRSKEIIDEIFSKNLEDGNLTMELAQCLMVNMISTMIRAVNEISNSKNDNLLVELNPVSKLMNCKTIDQMKSQLNKFLKAFCSYVDETNVKSSNWIVNDVIPYINQHYSNPDLGLSQIADEFHVHPVHLSKTFKDQVGEGLLDYITKIRVEKSKLLLKNDLNSTVERIAEQVGYPNVRTFSRVFKKYTGTSPGLYREQLT